MHKLCAYAYRRVILTEKSTRCGVPRGFKAKPDLARAHSTARRPVAIKARVRLLTSNIARMSRSQPFAVFRVCTENGQNFARTSARTVSDYFMGYLKVVVAFARPHTCASRASRGIRPPKGVMGLWVRRGGGDTLRVRFYRQNGPGECFAK